MTDRTGWTFWWFGAWLFLAYKHGGIPYIVLYLAAFGIIYAISFAWRRRST